MSARHGDLSTARIRELVVGGGVRLRCATFALEGARAQVLLLTGRNEFVEKHLETVGELVERGFLVHTFDWRGQGLSDRPLPGRQRGYVADFSSYVEDLEAVARALLEPSRPTLLLGHSMGAHVALRWLHAQRPKVAGAVFTSPMLDLYTGLLPASAVARLARLAVLAGLGEHYALGMHDYRQDEDRFEGNVLTRDPRRFGERFELLARDPRLRLGGVTWGWLDAAFRSMKMLRGRELLRAIDIPMLLVAAGADSVVPLAAVQRAARLLPRCELVTLADSRHEPLHELDATRARLWSAFDDFVAGRPELARR